MEAITIQTNQRTDFVDITTKVQEIIDQKGFDNGLLTLFVPHTTAGITINEHADPDVMDDMKGVLDEMVPWNGPYAHAEGNTAAHVKASLMGSSVQVPVEGGRLQLGTWQGIFFSDFDGPRSRQLWVCVSS